LSGIQVTSIHGLTPFADRTKAGKNYTPTVGYHKGGNEEETADGLWTVLLGGPNHGFLDPDRPIDAAGFDDQVVQAWVFGHIGEAVAVTVLVHSVQDRSPADGTMHDDMERTCAWRCGAFGLPLNSPLRAIDVEGLGLRVASA
jgi:hypothetical protein